MPIRAEISSTSGVTAVVGGTGAAPVIRASSVGERIGRFSIATTANAGDSAVLSEGTAISADANTLAVHQGNLDEKILGFVLVANRPGLTGEPPRFGIVLGNFFMSKKFSLPVAGEAYTVKFVVNRDDDSSDGDELSMTVAESSPSSATTIDVHYWLASPSVGATAAELNSVKADVSRIEQEVQAVQAAETSVPTGTQAEASAGSSNANRLWSAALLWTAARASAGLSFLARTLGGFTRSVSVSGGQIHVVGVDSQGNPVSVSTTISASSGGSQAHTDEQIQNICGALVATLPSFSYDAATQTLTYSVPLPSDGSITLQMLATSLQNLIAGNWTQAKFVRGSNPIRWFCLCRRSRRN